MNIKKSLKIALAMREMTMGELSIRMGISAQRMYVIGTQEAVRSDTVGRIAKALGFKTSEFIALGEE